jgi:two-component system, cell cycle sensor histidine kinase and response regulator CckA
MLRGSNQMKQKTIEKTSLKVLYLEDSLKDVEIIRELLIDAGYDLSIKCTENKKEFTSLLRGNNYDIILSDFSVPGFDAFGALQLSNDLRPEIPFICVSGSIGEDIAIDLIKKGAVDYVLKDRMARLPLAIKRALDEVKEKQTRHLAEDSLRESEQRFQVLAENSPVGIFQTDAEGSTTYVNPRWCQISGLSKEEALGNGWFNAVHNDDKEKLSSGWKKAIHAHNASYAEYRFVRKDGTIAWVIGQAVPEKDEKNKIVGYVGTITDITERKWAEEELKKSQDVYRSIFENTGNATMIVDENTIISLANNECLSVTGYSPEKLVGTSWTKHVAPDSLELMRRNSQLRYQKPESVPNRYDVHLLNAKGEVRDTTLSIGLIPATHQSVVSMLDITERKRAEEELSAVNMRQQAILAAVPDIIMEVDNKKIYTWANKAGMDFFGNDVIGKEASYYFEGDQDTYNVAQPLFNGNEDIIYIESWQRRKDGEKRLLAWWCRVLKDRSGNVTGALSSARDITERKQAEEALRESEESYRKLFENHSAIKIILDPDTGTILDANNAAVQYYGWTREELKQMNIHQINTLIHEEVNDLMHQVKLEGRTHFEFCHRRADGSIRDVEVFSSRIEMKGKDVLHSIIHDITERKRVEEALRDSEEIFKQFMDHSPVYVFFKDENIRAIRLSKNFETMLGKPMAELLGKNMEDLFPSELAKSMVADDMRILKEGKEIIVDEELNGRYYTTIKFPLHIEGKPRYLAGYTIDVTERRQAEEALRESERQLNETQKMAQLGHWIWDVRTGDVEWSEEVFKTFQLDPKTFTPQIDSIMALSPWPKDHERDKELIRKAMESHEKGSYEQRFLRPDKSIGYYFSTFLGKYDDVGNLIFIVGTVQDITERKQAEETLRETHDYLENLLSFANAPIIVWDPHFKITRFNQALERLTGYTIHDVIGKHLEMLFPAESRKSSLSLIVQTSEGDHQITVEIPILCKDGNVHSVLWSSAKIYAADGQTLVSTIAQGQDITEQKKLQKELFQSQKMESIGTLAGGIAHDFNNILGIILGYSTIMEQGTLSPEKFRESLGIINNAVGRGAALVRQILTFARKTDVISEPMSIVDLIHELISMFMQTFPKIITLIEDVDKELPLIIADRTQLHQVLLNLCVNARDAMPKGGLLTIRAEKQTKGQVQEKFPAADQDSYICVSVTDTGEGMDEATRRQIFDPFFTTKEQGKGTGLGLAVVYGVVQSHHGFIDVESVLGRGTTFRLYFPIPIMSEQQADASLSAEPFTTGGTETLLLIEDEDALIEIVRLLLESKGYKVYTAQDGNDAIKVYKQHKKEIDIVLTDMGLPGMTGTDVHKKLRDIDPNVSVIFASGFFEPHVKSELYKAGAKGFIQKPYSPDEVLRKLREVLDEREK